MKALLIGLLLAPPAFATIADSTYTVTPPVSHGACPSLQTTLVIDPCAYTVPGDFTDTYLFSVPVDAVYSFTANGNHWHRCVLSGRVHPCYTESLTITSAVVVDPATGSVVLELTSTGSVTASGSVQDFWGGTVELPPGEYALLISASVTGNRPGTYGYSIALAQ
jgi:hypothetical protein